MLNSLLVLFFLLGIWIVFMAYVTEVPLWLNMMVSIAMGWFSPDIADWLF